MQNASNVTMTSIIFTMHTLAIGAVTMETVTMVTVTMVTVTMVTVVTDYVDYTQILP